MASAKTSLNGYKYGREPETETPFWGGESGGAEIDDSTTSTVKTWSSKKISDELADKADASDLADYAKVTTVYTKAQTYTKEEVNDLFKNIPSVDAYTKAEVNTLLADKADKSDTYTKSQVNNLIPDVSGLATKTELNSSLATKANSDDVYSKSQTYTKSEVNNLIADIPAVDAYTKTQTDTLLADKANVSDLANYAKATAVYTKSESYSKQEVDNLISGVTPSPVDAYTKAQTDTLLADKANASDVYTKTQTDNLLADKANSSDVYSKSQTYTKTEVDDLISHSGGGGAEIDDTTSASDKVWSSQKTRNSILKASGLTLSNGVPVTWVALVRQKISGSSTSVRNAMQEQFSADYQYSLSGGTVTVTIMYENGGAGQTYTINLTDIPWNDVASADQSTNYPSDNSRWKTIVASEDIFEICIGGNVSGSSGYYYPYIFVRVPKGTYASSISLSANLGNNKWKKAGKVSVINGYVDDPTAPLFTKDITSEVNNNTPAITIINNIFSGTGGVLSTFANNQETLMKFNKMVIERSESETFFGNMYKDKYTWEIRTITTSHSISPEETIINDISMVYDPQLNSQSKWVYTYGKSSLTKVTINIPNSNGNVTGSKVDDSTTTLVGLVGRATVGGTWTVKFYQ